METLQEKCWCEKCTVITIEMPDHTMMPRIFKNDKVSIDTTKKIVQEDVGIYAIFYKGKIKICRLCKVNKMIMLVVDGIKTEIHDRVIGRVIKMHGASYF